MTSHFARYATSRETGNQNQSRFCRHLMHHRFSRHLMHHRSSRHLMHHRSSRQTRATLAAVAVTAGLLLSAACEQRVEPPMALDSITWTEYRNDDLGVTVEVPSTWQAETRGNSVRFEGDVTTAMRLTLATPEEAERRGLWGRTPVVRVDTSADLGWRFYRYRHYDGPTYTPTLAFVVSHRGQELGIEFRTRAAEPDAVERHILESVRLN